MMVALPVARREWMFIDAQALVLVGLLIEQNQKVDFVTAETEYYVLYRTVGLDYDYYYTVRLLYR